MGSCLLKNFHFVILLLYSCSKEQESENEGGSTKKLNTSAASGIFFSKDACS